MSSTAEVLLSRCEYRAAGVYDPAKVKRPVKMEETLSPLEQVIQKINEQYMGEFTDGSTTSMLRLSSKPIPS